MGFFSNKKKDNDNPLNLSENELLEYKSNKLFEQLLDINCKRLCNDVGRTIVYAITGKKPKVLLYLKSSDNKYYEFITSYTDLVANYESALNSIRQELISRFYYVR